MKEKFNLNRVLENISIVTTVVIFICAVFFTFYTIANIVIGNNLISSISNENIDSLKQINEVINKLDTLHIDKIEKKDVVEGAIKGILYNIEDPYSRFVDIEEYNKLNSGETENYVGIGVHITYDTKTEGIRIISAMKDSPAIDAGILPGDIIIKVKDIEVNRENYSKVIDELKGLENTKVNIEILRNNKILKKEVLRKKIDANNIDYKVLDNNIGYIKIYQFENESSSQFKEAYNNLLDKNINSLIIDLRDNPGGLVNEVVDIAKNILPKGEILKIVYKDGKEQKYVSDGKNEIKIPLVVLVNERSASASEILAGSIKDLKAGTIFGNKTFGKGIVQSVIKLNSGIGAISITTAKYYTASGNVIHNNGIIPDKIINIKDEYKNNIYIPYEEDEVLKEAINFIKNK